MDVDSFHPASVIIIKPTTYFYQCGLPSVGALHTFFHVIHTANSRGSD